MIDLKMRFDGESFDDYFVRLFENAPMYNLKCQEIADLLNEECGEQYNESKWRKDFKLFDRGRIYERNKLTAGVATRILALSDFHVPFALPKETFADYVGVTDILVLNGDLQDAQSCSAFPKKYRIPFVDEMILCRQYIIDLVEYIKPKRVVVTRGNHEDRLLRLLSDSLNTDLLGIMPDSPLDLIINDGFKNRDRYAKTTVWYEPLKNVLDIPIEYNGEWWVKIGKTIFAHPLAYSGGMLKTTEKAVNHFLRVDRDFDTCVLAHTHKLGQFIQGNIQMFEQGCCCKIEELNYMDGKLGLPQQKGFLYICQDKDGGLLFDKCKLVVID